MMGAAAVIMAAAEDVQVKAVVSDSGWSSTNGWLRRRGRDMLLGPRAPSSAPPLAVANALSGLLPDCASGAIRGRLYRWAGFRNGHGAFIMGNLSLSGLSSAYPDFYDKLIVRSDATIADHVTMNLDATVTVGENVAIAPQVVIYTGSHRIGPGSMRIGAGHAAPVTIEDGAWVRLGAVIAPGVTIGRGSIVATGAVVL